MRLLKYLFCRKEHNWKYNFKYLPTKRKCKVCGRKEKITRITDSLYITTELWEQE